jgi:hypothetical protein
MEWSDVPDGLLIKGTYGGTEQAMYKATGPDAGKAIDGLFNVIIVQHFPEGDSRTWKASVVVRDRKTRRINEAWRELQAWNLRAGARVWAAVDVTSRIDTTYCNCDLLGIVSADSDDRSPALAGAASGNGAEEPF